MDKRIIFLIIIFWVGSLSFFLYRKFYFKPEGISYEIRPRDAVLRTGDSISYKDQTRGANRWKWDFGDGEFSSDQNGQHLYLVPGKFTVSLTVYGSFGVQRDNKTVINVLAGSTPTVSASAPSIMGPTDLQTGQSASFNASVNAASYDWKVEGDATAHPQKGATVNYSFSKPGVKTLVLTMHNPDNVVRKSVTVIAAAPAAVQAKPVVVAPPVQHQAAVPHPHPKPVTNTPAKSTGLPDIGEGVEYHKK